MAELRPYEPTWRDRIAQIMMGNAKASPERRRVVEGLLGSSGLGNTGMGVVDVTPVGGLLQAQEAVSEGDPRGAALAVLPIPGAAKAKSATKTAADVATPQGIRAYHGSDANIDKFQTGFGRTAQHIYASPIEEDAKQYGKNVYELSLKGKVGDFRPENRGPEQIKALRSAYKEQGLSDYFDDFDDFLTSFDEGQMYQRFASQRPQNFTMSGLFDQGYDVLRVPDAGFKGAMSESYVVRDPNFIDILRKYGLVPGMIGGGAAAGSFGLLGPQGQSEY